ncbi:MAG: NAD(P)-binding domain-containing protein [Caldimicrobium sp.]|nr:NAD(P)-binding domain-containing protein [Caldimicrobium sp.]
MPEKIVFFESKDWEKERFIREIERKLLLEFPDLQVDFVSFPLREDHASLCKDVSLAVIYLNSLVTEKVIETLPNLKYILTRTTGIDQVDIAACKKRGIQVANTPYYASVSVAEHTFALIFALARRLRTNFEKIQRLDFSREGLLGADLYGKVLGVIGTGNIGSHLCRLGHGIGMKVIAYDVSPSKELIEKYEVQYVPLEMLLRESDVITVMVPYYGKTHHMINMDNIKSVKPKAMLINAARGPVVDTQALIWALENGRLQGGVALDVFEGERALLDLSYLKETLPPEIAQRALLTLHLLKFPQVIFTPHIAYFTEEAINRLVEWIVEDLQHYLRYRTSKVHFESYF